MGLSIIQSIEMGSKDTEMHLSVKIYFEEIFRFFVSKFCLKWPRRGMGKHHKCA